MHALTLRKIDSKTYESLKQECKKRGLSLNKFIVDSLKKMVDPSSSREYDDLDSFFGTWKDKDAKSIEESLKITRKIDRELWK